jgi:hypothetical protein
VAASKTVIANLALSHLGIGKEIADIDTESSAEANTMRRFYEIARDKTLRDFNWPFATKIANLVLVETSPNNEWAYSYRYPSDCLRLRKIQSGIPYDNRQSRIPYRIGQDDSGKVIFCNLSSPVIEYTKREIVTSLYDSDFTMAFSYLLAHYSAPRLSGGDPFKVGDKAMANYDMEISKAKATSYNEEQAPMEPESSFVRIRDSYGDDSGYGNNN